MTQPPDVMAEVDQISRHEHSEEEDMLHKLPSSRSSRRKRASLSRDNTDSRSMVGVLVCHTVDDKSHLSVWSYLCSV